MEEKGKGISLRRKRTKRPTISAPRPVPPASEATPRPAAGTPLDAPRERPQLGGQTSDFVKRRYSTRFTNLPQDYRAGAPSVPSIPSNFGGHQPLGHEGQPGQGDEISVDLNALRDPHLEPEQYVAKLLSNASEQEIHDYQLNLRKTKNRASTDLQQNVFQNRTQFIKISKEAEKLKSEMRSLRSLMSDLTNALGQATTTTNNDLPVTRARKQANRSSVANLEGLWNTQLQGLWKNVEGSQKFLPAVPGRHVIRDSRYWVELNVATWKPRRAVNIFLLNDHLLVASRKQKRVDQVLNGASQQTQPSIHTLIAERCWPLQDIEISDLPSGSGAAGTNDAKRENVAHGINIRVGQEYFTYRNDKLDGSEKVNLLLDFRKTVDELRRNLTSETGGINKARNSRNYLASRDPTLSRETGLLNSLSSNTSDDKPDILIEVDGKQQNYRWLENQIDDLDIEISLQRLEESVAMVEKFRKIAKGLKGNSVAQDLITLKIDERAGRLAGLLTRQLVDTHSFLNATQTHVGRLVRLGFQDRAREAYLEARTSVIAKRARQCVFEGDLHQYIFQISFVYFTMIKNTVNIYQACFPPLLMSACVKWAKEHVDAFNETLARQLSGFEPGSRVWVESMNTAKDHAMLMTEVGLDFKDLVGNTVSAPSKQTAEKGSVGLGLQ
ncbi:MAG: exocyst complex component exo84 [Candelina mexicana]|nr:MAG: exocyst complex component exo84 [Candelina mexicana]